MTQAIEIKSHAQRNAEYTVGRKLRMCGRAGEAIVTARDREQAASEDELGTGEIVATWVDRRNQLDHRLWIVVVWEKYGTPMVLDPCPGAFAGPHFDLLPEASVQS